MISGTYDNKKPISDNALKNGCRFVCGGNKMEQPQNSANGFWLKPIVVSDVKPEMRVVKENVFGHVLSIITFNL